MKILLFILIIYGIFMVSIPAMANGDCDPNDPNVVCIPDPLENKTITEIINSIIDGVIAPIVFGLTVIMIIWSGIMYMTAGGSEEKVTKARKMLIWTIVGFAIAISARFIVKLLEEVLKGT